MYHQLGTNYWQIELEIMVVEIEYPKHRAEGDGGTMLDAYTKVLSNFAPDGVVKVIREAFAQHWKTVMINQEIKINDRKY